MKTFNLIFTLLVVLCTLNPAVFAESLELDSDIADETRCKSNCVAKHGGDYSYYADSYLTPKKCTCVSVEANNRACRRSCIKEHNNPAYFASYNDKYGFCLCKANQNRMNACRKTCVQKYSNQDYQASYIDVYQNCLCKKH